MRWRDIKIEWKSGRKSEAGRKKVKNVSGKNKRAMEKEIQGLRNEGKSGGGELKTFIL